MKYVLCLKMYFRNQLEHQTLIFLQGSNQKPSVFYYNKKNIYKTGCILSNEYYNSFLTNMDIYLFLCVIGRK